MRTVLTASILATLLILGCAKKDKLVGNWSAEAPLGESTETFILQLGPDNKADLRNTLIIPEGGTMTIHATGTYSSKDDGGTLVLNFTEVTLDSPEMQGKAEDAKNVIIKRYNKDLKPVWKSDNEFEIVIGSRTISFKRQQ